MQNPTLTRWELTPIEKFESLLLELIDYLKATLVPIESRWTNLVYVHKR